MPLFCFLEHEMMDKSDWYNSFKERNMPWQTATTCQFTSSFPSLFSLAASLLVSCSLSSSFGFSSWFSSLLGLPRREPEKQRIFQLWPATTIHMGNQWQHMCAISDITWHWQEQQNWEKQSILPFNNTALNKTCRWYKIA